MNSIHVIHPYKSGGQWVFDDEKAGLVQEPFVAGADTIIERMVTGLDRAELGFTLVFSAAPFPGYEAQFEWRGEEMGGNWYYSPDLCMEGWLCPALANYYDPAPRTLYAQFKAHAPSS